MFLIFVIISLLWTAACDKSSDEGLLSDGDSDSSENDESDGESDTPPYPTSWKILISPNAPAPVRHAADQTLNYLKTMQAEAVLSESTAVPGCKAGEVNVVFIGDGLGEAVFENPEAYDQTFRMEETWCDDGSLILLSGGGLMGRQFAAYEWLHSMGVRFFHPEQEYVPQSLKRPAEPISREHTPDFKYRSVSLHLTHPLELGDAFEYGKEEYLQDALNYIDWQVKNGASEGQGGVGIAGYETYGIDKGFPTSAGFSLYGQQQGSTGLINPDDPRPADQQITDAIDERMGDDPANYPDFFSFSFNPTEFTEMDDELVVHQMELISNYIAENYPGVEVLTTNHGTYGEPTEHYGVRYYDLPKFAPENLGVKCHTLMFYDLFRPAPMYGNESFQFMYDFMESEYQKRNLWYFPEAAWWLTFDNQIPLYLPITIEARDRDIQGIKHMLEGKLIGHRSFGTGHEWGYWQNEYCSLRLSMDVNYRYTDCLADITYPMGPAAAEVQEVMENLILQQENEMIYGNILRYLVGTDPETEAAASVGVVFHPLPPSPTKIMSWTAEEVDSWIATEGAELQQMERNYNTLVAQLDDAAQLVPEDGRTWFDEIYDSVQINGLRARHQYMVYGSLVYFRKAQLELSEDLNAQAKEMLSEARKTTESALETIHRREESFRYKPIERAIGGGEECNADDNWSTYPFRVHCRTHTAYYWTRIDRLAEEVILATDKSLTIKDVVLIPEEALELEIVDPALSNVQVNFGDGESDSGNSITHQYSAPGIYQLEITADNNGEDFEYSTEIAVLSEKIITGFSGKIVNPDGMSIVESVMPGLVFGFAGENKPVLAYTASHGNYVLPGRFTELTMNESDKLFDGSSEYLYVPIISKSDEAVVSTITIFDGNAALQNSDSNVQITGMISIESVIQAVVTVGGGAFDEDGARRMVASFLGYTPETLPEAVAFLIEYKLSEEAAE